jgi:hypothetical protein
MICGVIFDILFVGMGIVEICSGRGVRLFSKSVRK